MRVGRLWITAVVLASIGGFFIGRAMPRSSFDDPRSPSRQRRSDAESTNEAGAISGVLNTGPEADHSEAITDSPKEVAKLTDASEPDTPKASVASSSSPATTQDEHVSPSMTSTALFTPGNASSSKKASSEA